MTTPVHQWTHNSNRVLMLRYVDMNRRSHHDFQWPSAVGSVVTAPDWNPEPKCGGGLHGWPWGIGIGGGKEPIFVDVIWQVVSALPEDVVDLDDKAKAREVRLEFEGSWWSAIAMIEAGRTAWIQHTARGAASATGESGAASATGTSGAASATGERGAASATGWSGAASATGTSGAASATGWSGIASITGEFSTVECGPNGIAVSTADEVTWIVRPGALFIHRWTGDGGGMKKATAGHLNAVDGERITFRCGKILKRVKP